MWIYAKLKVNIWEWGKMEREPELFDELSYPYMGNTEIKYQPHKIVNQKYVIQPNNITKAIYDMNLGSKRIVMMACSLLLERDDNDNLTAKKDLTVKFRLEDVMKTLNLAHGSTTKKMLENAIETIFDQKIRIRTEKGWTVLYHWFVESKYSLEKNCIELTFTPQVAQAFIDYLKGYSVINLDVYGNLTGKYSIRMYELCWSYHGFASKKDGTWKTPLVEVAEIRTMWQIEDSKYPMMSDFKKRVFDVAKKEINGYENSQFTVEDIEDVKQGKKIIGWHFHCKLKDDSKSHFATLTSPAAESKSDDIIAHEHQQEILDRFREMLSTFESDESKSAAELEVLEKAKQEVINIYKG